MDNPIKLKSLITEGCGEDCPECGNANYPDGCDCDKPKVSEGSRPTKTIKFAAFLKDHPDVENVVDIASQHNGVSALVRTKDGNAYEVQIIPAEYSSHPSLRPKTRKRADR